MSSLAYITSLCVQLVLLTWFALLQKGEELYVDHLLTRANSFSRELLYDSALSVAEKGLKLDHISDEVRASIYRHCAISAENNGYYGTARDYYRYAIYFYDDSSYYQSLTKGDLEMMYGNSPKARDIYGELLGEVGDSSWFALHNSLGVIYLGIFDTLCVDLDSALHHNGIAHSMNPSIQTKELLAETHHKRKEYAKAEELYEGILVSFPDDPEYLFELGVTEFYLKKHAEAAKHVSKALAIDSSYASDLSDKILNDHHVKAWLENRE